MFEYCQWGLSQAGDEENTENRNEEGKGHDMNQTYHHDNEGIAWEQSLSTYSSVLLLVLEAKEAHTQNGCPCLWSAYSPASVHKKTWESVRFPILSLRRLASSLIYGNNHTVPGVFSCLPFQPSPHGIIILSTGNGFQ